MYTSASSRSATDKGPNNWQLLLLLTLIVSEIITKLIDICIETHIFYRVFIQPLAFM